MSDDARPLDGVRVIELGHLIAGPFAATLLAYFGAEVIKLRFFVGMSHAETAELLGVSTRTVERDWDYARAWLQRHMDEHGAADSPGSR